MRTIQRPKKLRVFWEPPAKPDHHALLKAVAMLFGRKVELSTDADLTNTDEELLCRRREEP